MATKTLTRKEKILKLIMSLTLIGTLMITLAGCKLSEKESRAKVRKQNESFEWTVDAKSQAAYDDLKPKTSK